MGFYQLLPSCSQLSGETCDFMDNNYQKKGQGAVLCDSASPAGSCREKSYCFGELVDLAKGTETANLTAAASIPFSFLKSNASVESGFPHDWSEEALLWAIQTLNTVVWNSPTFPQSRRLIGSCTRRHWRYDQHCLRYKLEYCGHRAVMETG